MDLDSILGVVIFISFVVWSLAFYVSLIPTDLSVLQKSSENSKDKLMDYMTSNVYSVPVKFASSSSGTFVLYSENAWYSGNKSTTRVFSGGEALDCRIIGDTLFWQADLVAGDNYYWIKFSDAPEAINCSGSFSTSDSNMTVPGVLVREKSLSKPLINNMTNTSYEDLRNLLEITEDFLIVIRSSSMNVTYGKNQTGAEEIFPERYDTVFLWEDEPVNVSISIW